MNGAVQRAELFANVDELMAWKKSFEMKQRELIEWQDQLTEKVAQLEESLNTTLRGCNLLVDADTVIDKRLDIVNKRLRQLENAK
jgi:exonuclease VII small subunit